LVATERGREIPVSGADDIELDPSLPANGVVGSMAVDAASGTAPTSPTEAIRGDAAIAEALAAGRIDSVAARELLLAEVAAEQLPADASAESIARLTAALRELLADDPSLARLLARA
jgi:hypothetical protein